MQKMSAVLNRIIYYSNHIMSNRNELVRRLLPGITNSELQLLQNLVRVREEARRPIPTQSASPSAPQGKQCLISYVLASFGA